MPLPATYGQAVEHEAIHFARGHLDCYYGACGNPWGTSDPLVSAGAGHAWFRSIIPLLLGTPIGRCGLIELAQRGWVEAADALRRLEIELRSQGRDLPKEIEGFSIQVRARGSDRWPKQPGPNKLNNLMRDLIVALTVAAVVDRFRLLPTQQSSRTISACSVVAKAMSGANRHGRVKAKAVEKIWQRYGNAMPTVPGWASAA
jgi:hypothetical protein